MPKLSTRRRDARELGDGYEGHAEDGPEPRLWNVASHGLQASRKAANVRAQEALAAEMKGRKLDPACEESRRRRHPPGGVAKFGSLRRKISAVPQWAR